MALQYSVAVRDSQNDAMETAIGASPTIRIRTGAPPANCAAADAGTSIADGVLPADWLTASAAGLKSKNGTWTVTGLPAAGTGTAGGHFRIYAGATCHTQGTFTATAGGGDMTADNNSIADAQVVTVNTYNITRGNA
jgi:hypothetical protein